MIQMENTLKSMRDCFVYKAWEQMGNLSNVSAKEMGEVIDIIKDLETSLYYHSLVEEDNEECEEWGLSPMQRKQYLGCKMSNKEMPIRLKELEKYINCLDKDIIEMMVGFSPEEHRMLHEQMMTLATKIGQMKV